MLLLRVTFVKRYVRIVQYTEGTITADIYSFSLGNNGSNGSGVRGEQMVSQLKMC